MRFRLIALFAFLSIGNSTSILSAATLDFSTAPLGGSFLTAPFEQNGIRLELTSGHYDIFDFGPTSRGTFGLSGNLDIGLQGGGFGTQSSVRISLVSGGFFNLNSIIFPVADSSGFLTGPGGASLAIDTKLIGLLSNPVGFQGITSFELRTTQSVILGGFAFDNVVLTPVPEPMTFALFALPFAALVLRRFQLERS